MSAMTMQSIPHFNNLSKIDLVKQQVSQQKLKRFLDPDPTMIANDIHAQASPNFHRLNEGRYPLWGL